jgi:hypothetical protein
MSSSGVIYAIIVGAWAVYLVPMWLRREDELNRARDTQRYAAAIKVLANKEAFERRWSRPSEAGAEAEAEKTLPIAVGQSFAPTSRAVKHTATRPSTAQSRKAAADNAAPTVKPVKRPTTVTATAAGTAVTAATAATAAVAATTARNAVTASIAKSTTATTRAQAAPQSRHAGRTAGVAVGGGEARPKSPGTTAKAQPRLRPSTGLMARRRRVVALLFAVSTLGALVSADLGARYLWAMATPAVLLSAYIARLRRDERIRVAARAAKRAEAQAQASRVAQASREAALARAEAEQARAEQAETARVEAQTEAEQRRRTEATRRRASAAARARAQAFAHEAPDLRQASNG